MNRRRINGLFILAGDQHLEGNIEEPLTLWPRLIRAVGILDLTSVHIRRHNCSAVNRHIAIGETPVLVSFYRTGVLSMAIPAVIELRNKLWSFAFVARKRIEPLTIFATRDWHRNIKQINTFRTTSIERNTIELVH